MPPDEKYLRETRLLIWLLTMTLLMGIALTARQGCRLLASHAAAKESLANDMSEAAPASFPTETATASPTPRPTQAPRSTPRAVLAPLPLGCQEQLLDGGFESGIGWRIPETAYTAGYIARPATYVLDPVHSGRRALRLGISQGNDVYSHSAAEQTVHLPAGAASIRLAFWMHTVTADREGDAQYVLALRRDGSYDLLMWELSNTPGWRHVELALDRYRGEPVTIQFGVLNDGDGALTALYVDDASLVVCGSR